MSEQTFVDGTEFRVEECCQCGCLFAMTVGTYKTRRSDKKDFYCSYGHAQHYVGKSDEKRVEELREQLGVCRIDSVAQARRAEMAEERARREKRKRVGHQGYATRLKRAAEGD